MSDDYCTCFSELAAVKLYAAVLWVAVSSVSLVADDWLCKTRKPVTAAIWWGSYIDFSYVPCQGQPASSPAKPDHFLLQIWTDIPKSPDIPFSRPNEVIWEYRAYDYDEVLVGYDKHPDGELNEPVFLYAVRLPEEHWFHQPNLNGIYWFSVVAVYTTPQSLLYPWGWTNHKHKYKDNAVTGYIDTSGQTPQWVWTELYDQTEQSEDMSFMLFTDADECSSCANYNLDLTVDFIDYADFADDWGWTGPPGGYNNTDLNCDGVADLKDLWIFALQWLDY